VGQGEVWTQGDGAANQVDRFPVPPRLGKNEAEQVQTVGMAGIDRQDAPIVGFRSDEVPRLVQGVCPGEDRRERPGRRLQKATSILPITLRGAPGAANSVGPA
jgi:hypothetical protein